MFIFQSYISLIQIRSMMNMNSNELNFNPILVLFRLEYYRYWNTIDTFQSYISLIQISPEDVEYNILLHFNPILVLFRLEEALKDY